MDRLKGAGKSKRDEMKSVDVGNMAGQGGFFYLAGQILRHASSCFVGPFYLLLFLSHQTQDFMLWRRRTPHGR